MCKEKFEKKLLDFVTVEFMNFSQIETKKIFNLNDTDSRLSDFEKKFYNYCQELLEVQRKNPYLEYYSLSFSSLNQKPSELLKEVLIKSNIAPYGLMPKPNIKEQMRKNNMTIYSTVVNLIPKELPNQLYSLISDLGFLDIIEEDDFFDSMLYLFKKNFNIKKSVVSIQSIPKEELLKELKLLLLKNPSIKTPRYHIDESIIDSYYI